MIGIDHLLGLVQLGKDNLTKDGVNCGDANEQAPGSGPGPGPGEIKIVLGDGRKGECEDVIQVQFVNKR